MINHKRVAILLCTYNGSEYLKKQIDSIVGQTEKNWVIFASDDGSSDNTLDILNEYRIKLGSEKFHILKGPGKGFAWNFLSLLESCGEHFDYFAFCDQDDEWMPEKLATGISRLSAAELTKPAVYCGRTQLVDKHNNDIGKSPLFTKPPSFKNALIQSIAGGNTMILNIAARNIVIKTPRYEKIISHDWWIYIIITAVGGNIYYDPKPTIKYRQHTGNIVGSNIGWFARFKRVSGLLDGHFKGWIDANILALKKTNQELTHENQIILNEFEKARASGFFKRINIFLKLGIYRQTFAGTLGLFVAILLKKM
ncbi:MULTISPECIES: glycosyltransferase family 2 protein [unclassified Erwinia]|uniref:glycosyltransferase family 2 protein n=1 Tax=unclassified Erwinia TaxID=2622719 RepID=UPI001F5342B4|nr:MULTISPECIES: glycosyltransferase family 2 protein [unclassified Erwinia]